MYDKSLRHSSGQTSSLDSGNTQQHTISDISWTDTFNMSQHKHSPCNLLMHFKFVIMTTCLSAWTGIHTHDLVKLLLRILG